MRSGARPRGRRRRSSSCGVPSGGASSSGATFRIVFEFMRGFRALHFVGPCVTVFGSARFPETHPYYVLARQLGGAWRAPGSPS